MIADEIFNLTIDRDLFESRGTQMLEGLLYVRKNDYTFVDDEKIIVELQDIRINGVDIQGDAISLDTRYLNVGFLSESEKRIKEHHKWGDTETTYNILSIDTSAKINEVKTISFKQEIGTSKKWMEVYIYIKDSYSKIKEEIKEIRG